MFNLWQTIDGDPKILRNEIIATDDKTAAFLNRVFTRAAMLKMGAPADELDKFPEHQIPGRVFGWRRKSESISCRGSEPAPVIIDYVYDEWLEFLHGEPL